jgi:hypothetical protein
VFRRQKVKIDGECIDECEQQNPEKSGIDSDAKLLLPESDLVASTSSAHAKMANMSCEMKYRIQSLFIRLSPQSLKRSAFRSCARRRFKIAASGASERGEEFREGKH